jgi:uncharacterized protein (TIGR03435 family)
LKLEDWPLSLIIKEAYSVEDFQIFDGPSWMREARFDILAKAEGIRATMR